MKITITTLAGTFVTAEQGGGIYVSPGSAGYALIANRKVASIWEQFDLIANDDGTHSFKTYSGNYITAEEGGGFSLSTNRTEIGEWEKFTLEGNFIRCSNNKSYWGRQANSTISAASGGLTSFKINRIGPYLSEIHVDGTLFKDENDEKWLWRGCTDFSLAQLFDVGKNIEPILQQRLSLSTRPLVLRVLMMNRWNGFWKMPLDKIGPFVDLVNEYHYCELSIIQDCQGYMTTGEQVSYFNSTCDIIRGKFVFAELGNEYDHADTNLDLSAFTKPTGIISANASSTESGKDAKPYWDYFTYHARRAYPKCILECAPYEATYGWVNRPCIPDEIFKCGKDSSDPYSYWQAGRVSSSLSGCTFHSVNGVTSDLFDDVTVNCAEAFYKAMD